MISAGQLRHRVQFEERDSQTDPFGQSIWILRLSTRAKIDPVSQKETEEEGQRLGTVTHNICVRYNRAIKRNMRIIFGKRIFNIIGIRNIKEYNRLLVVQAEELIDD